jgi:NAD(P)-dependent dehydrogenase (short-subunit alcohol dehydrogenase family)
MQLQGQAAIVTGGGSGLGAATARALAAGGAKVALFDVNLAAAQALAAEIGGAAFACDVTDTAALEAALAGAAAVHGEARIVMNIAGIGSAKRIVGKDGTAAPLEAFERVVRVNLIGTYNVCRLAAARLVALDPLNADGERGVMINTASIAAFEGQIGQVAYTAAKAGIAGMSLTMARDLGSMGIRVMAIAPSLFSTGLTAGIPDEFAEMLTKDAAFPKRMGRPEEYGRLAIAIVETPMLNGSCIRLDGGQHFAPK